MRRDKLALATFTNRIADQISAAPTMAVQSIEKISKSAFRLVCSHNPGNFSDDLYANAITAMYNNKFSFVEASVSEILDGSTTHGRPIVSMIVVANKESKPYVEEEVKGKLKLITANVFQDDSDKLWHLRGEGDNRVLVQESDDNYEEILNSRKGRSPIHASYSPEKDFVNGDYITAYVPKLGKVRDGFVLMSAEKNCPVLVDRETGNGYTIKASAIVNVADLSDEIKENKEMSEKIDPKIPAHQVRASLPTAAMAAHMDYMRKLYAGTKYFAQLEALMSKKKSTPDLPQLMLDGPSH